MLSVRGLEEEEHTGQPNGIFGLGAQDVEKDVGEARMRLGLGISDAVSVDRTHNAAAAARDRSHACGV